MGSESVFDGDWGKAEVEGKRAAAGVFLQKLLADDEDRIVVAFIQPPITVMREHFKDKTKPPSAKMIANIALFDDKGTNFIKVGFLEMAPKHWNGFLRWCKKLGGDGNLYAIERTGVANDTATTYRLDKLREITPDEITLLKSKELLEIKQDGADSAAAWLDSFRTDCATHCANIGWSEDQFVTSIKTFFGRMVKAADMTSEQRMEFLSALKDMSKGSLPEAIKDEPEPVPGPSGAPDVPEGGVLDLDEDVDFF